MPTVNGRVLDAHKQPIVGARVELWGLNSGNQRKPFGKTKTAANGQFRIEVASQALTTAFRDARDRQFEFRVFLGPDALVIRRGSPISERGPRPFVLAIDMALLPELEEPSAAQGF